MTAGATGRSGGPTVRSDLIARPRLLDALATRFDRPVTIITAGAGFGKTSLLAQSMLDPVAADRGVDVYLRVVGATVEAQSIIPMLVAGLAPEHSGSSVGHLIDHLLAESPNHVSLVLDDLHRFAPESPVWVELDELVANLPGNTHLVLAGRRRPDIKLARLLATGGAVELAEADLAFDEDETERFARSRNVPSGRFDAHGWPALLELAVHSGTGGAHDFLAEEILSEIEPDRLAALQRLAVPDIVDDDMVAALSDFSGGAAMLVADLPLRTLLDGGAFRLHDLWRDLLIEQMDPAVRAEVDRALAEEYLRRGDLAAAHAASARSGDAEGMRRVLGELALDYQSAHPVDVRETIVANTPADLHALPEMLIVLADAHKASAPSKALPAARAAVTAARAAGLDELEAHAVLRVAEVHYRGNDLDQLLEVRREFDAIGPDRDEPTTAAVAVLLETWSLGLDNSALKARELLSEPHAEPLASLVDYYRISLRCWGGRSEEAWREIEAMRPRPHGRVLLRLGGLVSQIQWFTGRLSHSDREEVRQLLARIEAAGQIHLFVEGAAVVSVYDCSAGQLADANELRSRAEVYRDRMPSRSWGMAMLETATAAADFIDGDEQLAAARLNEAMPDTGPFRGLARHIFGHVGALTYALVPRSRPFFEEEEIGPDYQLATRVGQAIVALRERSDVAPAAALPWNDLGRMRSWALEPHLAELAIAAMVGGERSARAALDSLRHDPRRDLRAVADRYGAHAVGVAAVDHLTTTPVRPGAPLRIDVLGELTMWRGDESLAGAPQLRRQTVRDLLLLLVHRRRVRRAEAIALLWPDKDERSGDANLRAALKHLRALTEADRSDADDSSPPWYVRSGVDDLTLFGGELLVVDSDVFSSEVGLGRAADRERRSTDALGHFRRAIELYRGDYLDSASESEWAQAHRTALHLDAVHASIRASELLTASGRPDEARDCAVRAIAAEPLAERGHRALARALDAAGDRVGARRSLREAITSVRVDGLEPEGDTIRLAAEIGVSV